MAVEENHKPKFVLRDESHPAANGRTPVAGEQIWTMRVPLEDGTELHLQMGAKGRQAFVDMIMAEAMDDKVESLVH